ncbi:hypothetical protein CEXT_613221 [Caerostris extrusa]|uniref:Uncharacterized protein n=1 Tax=Caerostris extrusa TaxID=172846 RepID=A0AAV4RT86_CAEEX|nr:hypothetical protein CEXT_613221 [Caerostris extrusa]
MGGYGGRVKTLTLASNHRGEGKGGTGKHAKTSIGPYWKHPLIPLPTSPWMTFRSVTPLVTFILFSINPCSRRYPEIKSQNGDKSSLAQGAPFHPPSNDLTSVRGDRFCISESGRAPLFSLAKTRFFIDGFNDPIDAAKLVASPGSANPTAANGQTTASTGSPIASASAAIPAAMDYETSTPTSPSNENLVDFSIGSAINYLLERVCPLCRRHSNTFCHLYRTNAYHLHSCCR